MALLRLIRWKNLFIIFLTQYLVWRCIFSHGRMPAVSLVNFCCIALSTIFIAAAGYVINDYYDIAIDAINKPGKTVVGTLLTPARALRFYAALNIDAMMLAGYVAWQLRHAEWLLIQLSCIGLLWLYSLRFKRWFVVGNVVVAVLAALTVIMLAVYEPAIRFYGLRGDSHLAFKRWVLFAYALFAFLLTWMREIVKDIEDIEGDRQAGCTTMPISKGIGFSVFFARAIGVITFLFLLFCVTFLWVHGARRMGIYTLAAVAGPLFIFIVKLEGGDTRQQFRAASQWLKVIMLLGIFSLTLLR